MSRPAAIIALAVLLVGCTTEETETPPVVPPSGCDPLELAQADGSCLRPGVPPDGCAAGFEHDGEYGCNPILPVNPCPPGLMALPGEAECRPLMDCGEGKWGAIPVDSTTEYVDGSFVGTSDGSAGAPWTTIGDAVTAAAPGALIAIAAGSYTEMVAIQFKTVRLWGVCPDLVEVVGAGQPVNGCPAATVCIINGSHGTEVGGVALTGAGAGVVLSGSQNVLLDRVHVHDNAGRGVSIEATLGPTSLELRGSLLEQNEDVGVHVSGADIVVDASVVLATLPFPSDQTGGRGINVQPSCASAPAGQPCAEMGPNLSVRGSLIEQNLGVGILAMASTATVEASVVRDTSPRASDGAFGNGLILQQLCQVGPGGPVCDASLPTNATVSGSVVEHNHDLGIFVMGSSAAVDTTVVRDTAPSPTTQWGGRGISMQLGCADTTAGRLCDPAARSFGSVTRSLTERSQEIGLTIMGSEVSVEATVVRDTAARDADGLFGDGITVMGEGPLTAVGTIHGVQIANSARAGLANFGATVGLADSHIECAGLSLAAQSYLEVDAAFEDGGGNRCGCPATDELCKLVASNLEPPEALTTD